MLLPEPLHFLLLVRTDYTDEEAWQSALQAANAVHGVDDVPRGGAGLQPVESPELAGLTAHQLVQLPRAGYLSALAVADSRTMQDQTVLFVDLNEFNGQVGRTFRAVPEQVEPITVNLGLGNADFFEFADAADPDGVFRGF